MFESGGEHQQQPPPVLGGERARSDGRSPATRRYITPAALTPRPVLPVRAGLRGLQLGGQLRPGREPAGQRPSGGRLFPPVGRGGENRWARVFSCLLLPVSQCADCPSVAFQDRPGRARTPRAASRTPTAVTNRNHSLTRCSTRPP